MVSFFFLIFQWIYFEWIFLDMMKSSDSMDHPLMELISTHLGEDWRMVVRDLGFSNAQLDQFQEDNIFKGVKEVGFHLYHIFFIFVYFF